MAPEVMNPEQIEFYKLGEVVGAANKAIAAFDKFVRKLAEIMEGNDIIFNDKDYAGIRIVNAMFASSIFKAVTANLRRHIEKTLDCGNGRSGYLVRTTLGDHVLVLVFPEIYPPEILVLAPKEADWCKEAK